MRRPRYNSKDFPPPEVSLARAYIALTAQHEPVFSAGDQGKNGIRTACLRIGEACVASQDDSVQAQRLVSTALLKLGDDLPDPLTREIYTYRSIAKLVGNPDADQRVQSIRETFQRQATDALTYTLTLYDQLGYKPGSTMSGGRLQETSGRSAKARTLASLNRPMHPWYMAVRSLLHQDRPVWMEPQGQARRHFDIMLVRSTPASLATADGETVVGNLIKVKNNCFGLCERSHEDGSASEMSSTFQETRQWYDPSITFVSGCCDFQLDTQEDRMVDTLAIDSLLIREYQNTATAEEKVALDGISAHVLHVATHGAELSRQGVFSA